jgi:tRNA (guanine-N7-)-methyltransferase
MAAPLHEAGGESPLEVDGKGSSRPARPSPGGSHPHIRSFSGRRGHITAGQRQAYETLFERWALPWRAERLDPAAAFGREAPLVLEIGFGMGESTAHIAKAMPERNFLGVEVYPAGVGSLLRRVDEAGLSNVRIIQHDAVEVVRDMIAPDSLAGVHVFFPDPWPKARHHKRRLIQAPFVSLLASRLTPGGYLHCATDWEHYAVQMLAVLAREPLLENAAEPDAGATVVGDTAAECRGFSGRPDYRPLTKFENRGLKLGHGVWDIVFRRRN